MKHARRTTRLTNALWHIGQVAGGQGGTRLACHLSMPTTRYTLLRLLRQYPLPVPFVTRVLGVDDWAKRRGQRYGTILVDLERHRVIDLLPDRTPETLTNWLIQQPAIQVVARDRSSEYAAGIHAGAPQAMQVADRWHLLKNLSEMTERALADLWPVLRQSAPTPVGASEKRREKFPRAQSDLNRQQASREKRVQIYTHIQLLKRRGCGQRQIARILGLSRGTVRRYFHATAFPESPARRVPSLIDPYLEFLEQRYAAGTTNAQQLWREIRDQGYPGSSRQVNKWVQTQRHKINMVEDDSQLPMPFSAVTFRVLPTLKTCLWLLIADPKRLTPQEAVLLKRLQLFEVLHRLHHLVQRFAAIIRQRLVDRLDEWLADSAASRIAACVRFANSLKQDYAAVRAAVELPWSNGQTEGQIHRLKLLKR